MRPGSVRCEALGLCIFALALAVAPGPSFAQGSGSGSPFEEVRRFPTTEATQGVAGAFDYSQMRWRARWGAS